jgi:hypothetical protein
MLPITHIYTTFFYIRLLSLLYPLIIRGHKLSNRLYAIDTDKYIGEQPQ